MEAHEWFSLMRIMLDVGWLAFAFALLRVAYHLGMRYTGKDDSN